MSGQETTVVFDRRDLLERLGGDEQVLEAVVRVFVDDAPEQLARLAEAVRRGDPGAVRDRAHGLKGAAANLSGGALRRAAYELEQAGARRDIDAVSALFDAVKRELDALLAELKNII